MKRHHYSREDVARALGRLGIERGDTLFTHSNIGFLGIPEKGMTPENAFETVFDGFLDVLGDAGTLVVPAFTYSFPRNEPFDPDRTPGDCGLFSEMLRVRPGSRRSEHPCISVAAFGARAVELTEDVSPNGYDGDSFFARFHEQKGKICNINFDAGSTFIHYVERCLGVPYRFDKTFSGTFIRKGRPESRDCTIWVRYTSDSGTEAAFEPFHALAVETGAYRTEPVGRGFIGTISSERTRTLISDHIGKRPWLLTRAESTGVVPLLVEE